ncbi:unnamed protein product [Danaus chrysippus]|uniref:Phosphatidylinositol-glycan biosynthesis class X protein n=1 Tax=Danaus chrysippus TaxID=151541 RepID=A0A8J2W0C0_9NEOP|nr:unnamed protein product [Danaus chrysippus]
MKQVVKILNYTITLPSEDEFSKWLYDDCLIGIEQTLPAGLYASPDEVKSHKCKELIYTFFKSPVNTELFAEDATPLMMQLFSHITNNTSHIHIHVPVHARYHRARAEGRAVKNNIPHPKLYLYCPKNKLDQCGDFYSELSQSNSFCPDHVSLKVCHWKQLPAVVVSDPLEWHVAVGNSDHYYIVTFGTVIVMLAGTIHVLKTVHRYKIQLERNKKQRKRT